jgi:hypothetical protein
MKNIMGLILCLNSQNLLTIIFCIDVTFEMRTVLYGIRLLIDSMKMPDRVFISNQDYGEVSSIAERPRKRVRERQHIAEKERWRQS